MSLNNIKTSFFGELKITLRPSFYFSSGKFDIKRKKSLMQSNIRMHNAFVVVYFVVNATYTWICKYAIYICNSCYAAYVTIGSHIIYPRNCCYSKNVWIGSYLTYANSGIYAPKVKDGYNLLNIFLLRCVKQYGWLGWLYAISNIVGYLTPNPIFIHSQFFFKQFSLEWVHSLIVKNIFISSGEV